MLDQFERRLSRVEDYLAVVIIVVMSLAVLFQVISRFVIKAPLSYTEELSRYMLIWLTFIGASLALHDDKHFAVDVLSHRLSAFGQSVYKFIITGLMLAYLVVLFANSIPLLEVAAMQTSAALDIPMDYVYLAIPVGTGLMIVHAALSMVNIFLGLLGRTPLRPTSSAH